MMPQYVLEADSCHTYCLYCRHKAIVAMVRDKLDDDSGTVLAAMLASSRSYESSLQVSACVCLYVFGMWHVKNMWNLISHQDKRLVGNQSDEACCIT